MRGKTILILGGARSGKSTYAQKLAETMEQPVLFIATATPEDEEMVERIARHKASRPSHWQTLEAPLGIGELLKNAIGETRTVLLDCVALLLSNIMMKEGGLSREDYLETQVKEELLPVMEICSLKGINLIIVSNEVGMGLVPPYPMGRVFRDVLGRVNQWLAAKADEVVFMVAGIPIRIK